MLHLDCGAVGGGVDVDHNVMLFYLRSLWGAVGALEKLMQVLDKREETHLNCRDRDPGSGGRRHGRE